MGSRQGKPTHTYLVSTSRADFSTLFPIFSGLVAAGIEATLLICGDHTEKSLHQVLNKQIGFGSIEVGPLLEESNGVFTTNAIGLISTWIQDRFTSRSVGDLIIVGDRLELLSVLIAAAQFNPRIFHFSGGDLTLNSIDNKTRYAVSAYADYHFVNLDLHKKNLVKSGIQKSRIFVTGDPALDLLPRVPQKSLEQCLTTYLIKGVEEFALFCFHPYGSDSKVWLKELKSILDGLKSYSGFVIATRPNADYSADKVREILETYQGSNTNFVLLDDISQQEYYELMNHASFMIGNSSSGIWESPSLKLPVINMGGRQFGRVKAANIIDIGPTTSEVIDALEEIQSKHYLKKVANVLNPYEKPNSVGRFMDIYRTI
jgi:UDP-hydrolysing UDP-N-acetyl-D-glucosamine 2-epimerase